MKDEALLKYYEIHANSERKYIERFMKGEVTTEEYLGFCDRLDRSLEAVGKVFHDYESFASYMKTEYPLEAEIDIGHESEHWEIAKGHGLEKFGFGVLEGEEIHVAFLIDYMSENCRGWSKERILDYLRETHSNLNDASRSDKLISELFIA
jgi:hypothetical protein